MLALTLREASIRVSLLTLVGITFAIPTNPPPVVRVFNFGAFISNHPSIPSHLAFHIRDGRQEHYLDIDCTFVTSEAQPSIYTGGWTPCDKEFKVAFWLERDAMRLRRAMRNGDVGGKVTIGVTDRQLAHWFEAKEGACTNVTRTVLGTTFSRTAEWMFPLTTVLRA